jgi:hypothetical protein
MIHLVTKRGTLKMNYNTKITTSNISKTLIAAFSILLLTGLGAAQEASVTLEEGQQLYATQDILEESEAIDPSGEETVLSQAFGQDSGEFKVEGFAPSSNGDIQVAADFDRSVDSEELDVALSPSFGEGEVTEVTGLAIVLTDGELDDYTQTDATAYFITDAGYVSIGQIEGENNFINAAERPVDNLMNDGQGVERAIEAIESQANTTIELENLRAVITNQDGESQTITRITVNGQFVPIDGLSLGVENTDTDTYYTSIQSAIDNAQAEETVKVEDGTYEESVTVDVEGLTLEAADGASPTISPPASNGRDDTITASANGVTIRGLNVEATGGSTPRGIVLIGDNTAAVDNEISHAESVADTSRTGPLVAVDGGDNVDVEDNTVTDGPIEYVGGSDNQVDFIDNTVEGDIVDEAFFAFGGTNPVFTFKDNDFTGADTGQDSEVKFDLSSLTVNDKTDTSAIVSTTLSSENGNEGIDVVEVDGNQFTDSETLFIREGDDINNAIGTASSIGVDTVHLASGTYDEQVTVDVEDLTLQGPNAEIPDDESRNDEAVIKSDTGDEGQIEVLAEDVTIEGLEIGGDQTQYGIVPYADGFTAKNNVFEAAGTGITLFNWKYSKFSKKGSTPPEDVRVIDNRFESDTGVGGIEGTEGRKTDVYFEDNVFEDTSEAIGVGSGTVSFAEDRRGLVSAERGYTAYYTEISEAIENANSDTTVEVMPGTYEESVEITENGLTIEGEGRDSTTIEAGSADGTPTIAVDANNIEISNMAVERTGSDDRVAQAVRIAGSDIELINNTYSATGSNDAAIAVLTDSSGAAGNPDVSGETFEGIKIRGGEIKDSVTGLLVANNGDASLGENPIDVHSVSFKGNEYGVYLTESVEATVNATHNYWGQSSGPTGDQVSENVDYRPWRMNSTDVEGYDEVITFSDNESWSAFSIVGEVEEAATASGAAEVLSYNAGWTSPDVNDISSVDAAFVKNTKAVGVNYVEDPGTVSRSLGEGWNFVGAYDNGDDQSIRNVFGPVESSIDVFQRPVYNDDKTSERTTDLVTGNIISTSNWGSNSVFENDASVFDGYWVKASESAMLSTTPELVEEG